MRGEGDNWVQAHMYPNIQQIFAQRTEYHDSNILFSQTFQSMCIKQVPTKSKTDHCIIKQWNKRTKYTLLFPKAPMTAHKMITWGMQLSVPLAGDTPLESYSLSPYQLRPPKVRPLESHRHTTVNTLKTFNHYCSSGSFWQVKIIQQKSACETVFPLDPWDFKISIKCDKISCLKAYMGKPHFPRKVDIM